MASNKNTPLGYVQLKSGAKAIFPMNNTFLNYTFEIKAHWEALRLFANLVIDAFKQLVTDTRLEPIEGNIEVRTQFRHLVEADDKTTFRDQDIKMTEDEDAATYVEFQNRANTDTPIEIRSVDILV